MEKPLTVVVGKLETPHRIRTEAGETINLDEWRGRAVWSYLRLIYGRSIDDIIKRVDKEQREDFFYKKLRLAQQTKPVQFILSSNDVHAVASTKHLLIQPQQVYETAQDILGASLKTEKYMDGQVLYTGNIAGIKIGYQIDGGDLTTRFAVRVGVFARVEMCFNPLSWLGVSGLGRFSIPSDYERILRVKKLNELFPRLEAAITNAKTKLGGLEDRVDQAHKTRLTPKTAQLLNGAMCNAYGLGEKTIKRVMEQYQKEDPTQWGLAMAQSWEAQHGEHRKTPEGKTDRVPQSLSTISGATLMLNDIKTARVKARQWLGTQNSPLAKKLLKGKLP